MEQIEIALNLYIIAHLWWITHHIGRLEGKVFNNKNGGGNHE